MISAKITFYQDTRKPKANGKCPVRLRVYFQGKTRYYPVDLDLTEKEFEGATATNPRKNYLEYHEILEGIKEKAKAARDSLTIFTFEAFERKLYDTKPPKEDVPGYYHSYIEELEKDGRVGTASSYSLSLKSLLGYHTYRAAGRKPEQLGFLAIDKDWLKGFERWMLGKGKSMTTVGIYLRPLRTIFNQAIADGLIGQDYYPFGKRKYQIPAGRNVKKALSKEELKDPEPMQGSLENTYILGKINTMPSPFSQDDLHLAALCGQVKENNLHHQAKYLQSAMRMSMHFYSTKRYSTGI